MQTLDDQGIRCQEIVERARVGGRSRIWLSERLNGIRSQIPGDYFDTIIRRINYWGVEQSRHGVRARPNVDRALLPVYNSLMAFKQYLFRSLPRALGELGIKTRTKSELEDVAEDYHRSLAMLEFSSTASRASMTRARRGSEAGWATCARSGRGCPPTSTQTL